MAQGIFLHRPDSIYEDVPEVRYQFPRQYLGRARQIEGDWVIYYEPTMKGRGRGYFAVARVRKIIEDASAPGMYLALVEPGTYLDFEMPVPFSGPTGIIERSVLNEAGRISGRAQAAVRPIPPEDFNRLISRGFPDEEFVLPRSAVAEDQQPFQLDPERERATFLSSRIVRDRVFRKIVLDAYDCRCAITGLRFINGGGRAEVEAAHIKGVEHHGPDKITNGIALSGTVHWMFDRGLISLSDDLDILVSRQVNDVDRVWSLANSSRKAVAPRSSSQRPHPRYLAWHREHCFKQ